MALFIPNCCSTSVLKVQYFRIISCSNYSIIVTLPCGFLSCCLKTKPYLAVINTMSGMSSEFLIAEQIKIKKIILYTCIVIFTCRPRLHISVLTGMKTVICQKFYLKLLKTFRIVCLNSQFPKYDWQALLSFVEEYLLYINLSTSLSEMLLLNKLHFSVSVLGVW